MPRYTTLLLFTLTVSASADVVLYEGTSFPDDVGWERADRLYLADRWLDDGWLVQQADIVHAGPPQETEDDFYRHSLAAFAGIEAFFVEWRMETDGPREGFPAVAPAALAAAGNMGIWYHFTIAEDQVCFARDPSVPILFVDIEPGVPHTYRLEVFGDQFYTWRIDGELVDYGIPEGPYPTSDSVILFGARAAIETITARWDYIRFGEVPEPASGACLLLGTAILLLHRKRPRRSAGTRYPR